MSASARIRITGRDIEISHPGPFGPGDMDRLLRRAFAHAETDSVHLEPAIRRFRIRLGAGDGDPRASLARLADLLTQTSVPQESLPEIPGPQPVTFRRWRGIVTTLSLQDQSLGQVRIVVPRHATGRLHRESLQNLRGLPGVHQVRTRRYPRRIVIGYDPKVDPTVWVRALERTVYPAAHVLATPKAPKIPSLMANTNLALCTTGQFFYPAAIPLVSGVLLLSRMPQFSKAARELGRGKIGAPFYGSVVVACSVAAMAPFASALAEWLTCVWERRVGRLITRESKGLIASLPAVAPLPAPGEHRQPVRLGVGDLVPFDGTLTTGELLVRDGLFTDATSAPLIRKHTGDTLVSGYQVIGGQGTLSPSEDAHDDRLRSVIRVLSELPVRLTEDDALKGEARRLGDLSVYPNLALAGVAYSMGGLHMAGALMHQDWMASPMIAAPTEFFRDLRTGLEHGALIRSPGALQGLAQTDLLLIEANYPGLGDLRPRVADIASEDKPVSRANAWASVLAEWVGDARSEALKDLARISDETDVTWSFIGFAGGKTELRIDALKVVLEDLDEGGEWPSLRIQIEGEPAETLRFESTDIARLARTFERLRALGIATALYGEGATRVGALIGVDATYPDVDSSTLARFRQELNLKGYASSLVAAHALEPVLVEDAPVVIGPLSSIRAIDVPTIQLLGDSLDGLPELVLAARTLRLRMGLASARTIPTNLLCILGAFAGTLNGTMTTVIAHTGVFGVSLIQGHRVKKSKPKGALI
ncbi:MAG: hypothetical protein RL333_964 [Pseudomonadota bacterium]